jgi:hypothetical protein
MVSEAVKLADVDVIAASPSRPRPISLSIFGTAVTATSTRSISAWRATGGARAVARQRALALHRHQLAGSSS